MPSARPQPSLRELRGTPLAEALLRTLESEGLDRERLDPVRGAIAELGATEVVDAVDRLVAERLGRGEGLESLKPAVAKFLNLVRRPLTEAGGEPDDPLFVFLRRENRRAQEALEALRAPVAILAGGAGTGHDPTRGELRTALAALRGLDLHYARLENIVFPYFEARYPRYRWLSLMWSVHDDVRSSLGELGALCDRSEAAAADFARVAGRLFFDCHSLFFREEKILFPLAASLLGPTDILTLFGELYALGPGLLDPTDLALLAARAEGYASALAAAPARAPDRGPSVSARAAAPDAPLRLDTGSLSPEVLDALLKGLPLDLTFIDAEDRVAYFSNSPNRIFPRSPAIIGRDVRNCHPPESLARVLGLIEDFRGGRREREAFWIERQGRLLHIEYFGIRDPQGKFLGVLEASEDITEKHGLRGEKRLAAPGHADS